MDGRWGWVRCGREEHTVSLATMTRRAEMCISGNSFSRSRGIVSRDLTRTYVWIYATPFISSFASWNGLGLTSPQSQFLRTVAQNVARSLGSHLKRCVLKPLSTRLFPFIPAPLQKSKESSKRKAAEKEASDDNDDAQLSEEERPPTKTVKTVKKVCESTHIKCKSGSRRTTAKNCL